MLARDPLFASGETLATTEFFPPQTNLYTVEAHRRPVVVISATSLGPPSDEMLADPGVSEWHRLRRRALRRLTDKAKQQGIDIEESANLREISQLIETYLGAELQAIEDVVSPGRPLWDGRPENIHVRRATAEEAETWKRSLLAAMQAGEQEPGDSDWLVFLVRMNDPTRLDKLARGRISRRPSPLGRAAWGS